jgi:hypothetical protein
MTKASEISDKIKFIKEIISLLTWEEMERLTRSLELYRISDAVRHWPDSITDAVRPWPNFITGEMLSKWARESEVD